MAEVCLTGSNAMPAVGEEAGAESSRRSTEHSPVSKTLLGETPSLEPEVAEPEISGELKTSDNNSCDNVLGNDVKVSEDNMMRFAEVLYKCTLCTSLPSILTSKESFLEHVTKEHLTKQTSDRDCSHCDLKFGTDEDLRAHVSTAHPDTCEDDSDADTDIPSSPEHSVSVSPKPEPAMDDSRAGPRVPMYVINGAAVKPRVESPTPIKKDFPCNKYQVVKPSAPVVKVNDLPKSETLSKIQKLTDQIVQAQTPGTQANLLQSWSNMSSFTPEFGRYTKLVREGGNIVYFCQVCNWKCQVKAAFQAHCNGPHHNNKVRIADQNNPHRKRGGGSASASPGPVTNDQCKSPSGLLMIVPKTESDRDTRTPSSGGEADQKSQDNVPDHTANIVPNCSVADISFLQGLQQLGQRSEESKRDCNGFTFQRRSDKESEATNPRLTAESFFEKSNIPSSKSDDDQVTTTRNKRKRPTPVSLRNQTISGNGWSDSDDSRNSETGSSDSELPDAKRHKDSDSPVARDDFHSRLIKKIVSAPSQKDKCESHSKPAHTDNGSPFLHSSFRNRLFASAFGASFGSMYGWYGQNNLLTQPLCSDNSLDKSISDNPFKNSLNYGSKLFSNNFTSFDYTGKHKQLSAALAARRGTSGNDDVSVKQEPGCDDNVFKCSMCEYSCQDIGEYRSHFLSEHNVDGADTILGESPFSSMNEGWKMSKIRDCLSDLLVESNKGNVSRDILLQKVSLLLGLPEVIHWGPACNKAVREVFQNSLAQRKGKYKKYFFGVALVEHTQETDDLSDSENVTYQPLRDMSRDLERILEHLPDLVCWTGEGETGVSRDELLELLADKMADKDVLHWGVQCNRAIRMLFPEVQMKRKGKYKTVFFGVDYTKNISKSSFIPTKRGRPRKLTDDEDGDTPSPPAPSQPCLDPTLLAWRAQMHQLKFFSQPRFQHHWRSEDGSPFISPYPPRDGPTEISKDYNFLASEIQSSYLGYHLPFGFTPAFPMTIPHKPALPEPEMSFESVQGASYENGNSTENRTCDISVEK